MKPGCLSGCASISAARPACLDGIALHEDLAVTNEVDQLTMSEVTTEMMTR